MRRIEYALGKPGDANVSPGLSVLAIQVAAETDRSSPGCNAQVFRTSSTTRDQRDDDRDGSGPSLASVFTDPRSTFWRSP
jgi:hypothetical protein